MSRTKVARDEIEADLALKICTEACRKGNHCRRDRGNCAAFQEELDELVRFYRKKGILDD